MFDEKNIVEVIDGNKRYCLCKNHSTAVREAASRQALLTKTTEALDKIMTCVRKTKYSKEVRAGSVIDKYKTDVSPEDMTATETVANYKSLMQVEQAFRNMKTVRLEIRPVYHKTDDRIKCHVFICMLAYYVMWHMNQRLKTLFDSDGDGICRKYTFDYIIEVLKSIRKETVDVCGVKSNIITAPSDEQNHIIQLLDVCI